MFQLGNPENTMETDPRVDPCFKDMYRPFEMTCERSRSHTHTLSLLRVSVFT